jgi:hypothetical protein
MLVIFLYLLSFNKEVFGCEVLYEYGTEEYKEIVRNLDGLHYFFVSGYSSVFGENTFVDSRMDNKIPFLARSIFSKFHSLNFTGTELDGDLWIIDFSTNASYGVPGVDVLYKKSKAKKKKAIILHLCELAQISPKVPITVRNFSYLFYFAEDKPNENETEIEELVGEYYHNITVLQKYSKYKDYCDIVKYTFKGCPDSKKFDYTFLWIFLFASAVILFIVSEMTCKQCLEPKRNRIEPEPIRNRTGVRSRNRSRTESIPKGNPKNVRIQTEPDPS